MISCYFENDHKKSFLRHVTVGALVIKNNQILLTKRSANLLEGGKYCYPGGYLNRDETTAKSVLRELAEETGYKGKIINIFLINDNPKRGKENRQNVNFVYLIKPIKIISKHDSEVTEVKWFNLNNLPSKNKVAFDHYNNILLYKKWLKTKKALPIFKVAK